MLSTKIKKCKHETLTLAVKMDILRQLDRRDKIVDLARSYNVGRAIIFDIRKNREKIEKICYVGRFGDRKPSNQKQGNIRRWKKPFIPGSCKNANEILLSQLIFYVKKLYFFIRKYIRKVTFGQVTGGLQNSKQDTEFTC